jgi:hypothetical protein
MVAVLACTLQFDEMGLSTPFSSPSSKSNALIQLLPLVLGCRQSAQGVDWQCLQ